MKKSTSVLIAFFVSTSAQALEYKCPESIATTQSISKTPSGWATMIDTINGQQVFDSLQVFSGNPSEGASLVPDNEGSKKDPYWTNHTTNGFWLACFYRQSIIRLTQEIPKSVKKCTLSYKTNHGTRQKVADKLVCL